MAAEITTSTIIAVITPLLALLGAAIGAGVSLRTNARNIKVENITKERAKWRENVREKALAVHRDAVKSDASKLGEHCLEFGLILNPFDGEDRAILDLIQQLKSTADAAHLTEFADRIALLLKHDWERAKWEAGGSWFSSHKMDAKHEPKRITYGQFRSEKVIAKSPSQ